MRKIQEDSLFFLRSPGIFFKESGTAGSDIFMQPPGVAIPARDGKNRIKKKLSGKKGTKKLSSESEPSNFAELSQSFSTSYL